MKRWLKGGECHIRSGHKNGERLVRTRAVSYRSDETVSPLPSKTSAGEDCHRGGDTDSAVTGEVRARAVDKKKESSCITNVNN